MQALSEALWFFLTAGLVLAVFASYVAGTALLAWWMLEPINRAGGQLRAMTRYFLTDFLGLMVLLQVALAVSGVALDGGDRREVAAYWSMLAVAVLLVLVLWAASVSVVSRAGIVQPLRRLTVIVLLIPGTLAAVMCIPFILVFGASSMWLDPVVPNRFWQAWSVPLAAVGLAALSGVIVLIRRLAFWSLESPALGQVASHSH